MPIVEDGWNMFTVTAPDGTMDYIDAESFYDAYLAAYDLYGEGVTIRPSFYKEWTCGLYKDGDRCGYTRDGRHVTAEDMASV